MGLVKQLQGQVAQLTAANRRVAQASRRAQGAGKRPYWTAPLQVPNSRPKSRPQAGYGGRSAYRKSPTPRHRAHVEVAVAEHTCPGRGGRLEHEGGVVYDNRHSSDSTPGAGNRVLWVPVLRTSQVLPGRSRCCAGPVRGQRAPGRETSDGGAHVLMEWAFRYGRSPLCSER